VPSFNGFLTFIETILKKTIMKAKILLLAIGLGLSSLSFAGRPGKAPVKAPATTEQSAVVEVQEASTATTTTLSTPGEGTPTTDRQSKKANRKMRKAKRKAMRKALIQNVKNRVIGDKGHDQQKNDNLLLAVILGILIPPLGVWYWEGVTTNFWIDLIFAILGGGFIFSPVVGGFWLVAIIFALIVILA